MEAFFTSTALVALAEMGDKTQLLAMLLATRFRKPAPIILGILAATLANHFLAALVGHSVAGALTQPWFRYAVAARSSDERRVGKEGVSTCRSRCSPDH